MNKFKKLVAIIIVAVTSFNVTQSLAQSPVAPTTAESGGGGDGGNAIVPPRFFDASVLKSQDRLREYALGKVVRGYRDVTSSTLVPGETPNTRYVEVLGNGAEDVLKKLFDTALVFRIANIQDKIVGRVWLYDAESKLLFFGQTEYFVATVGKTGPQYDIWQQEAPLMQDIVSAEILALG